MAAGDELEAGVVVGFVFGEVEGTAESFQCVGATEASPAYPNTCVLCTFLELSPLR